MVISAVSCKMSPPPDYRGGIRSDSLNKSKFDLVIILGTVNTPVMKTSCLTALSCCSPHLTSYSHLASLNYQLVLSSYLPPHYYFDFKEASAAFPSLFMITHEGSNVFWWLLKINPLPSSHPVAPASAPVSQLQLYISHFAAPIFSAQASHLFRLTRTLQSLLCTFHL